MCLSNIQGTPIRTTMDNTSTLNYIMGIAPIEERCSSAVRDIDPTNELQYIRIRSKRFEIMLKTGMIPSVFKKYAVQEWSFTCYLTQCFIFLFSEPEYLLYVIQNPSGAA